MAMGRTAKKAADPAPPYTPTKGERQADQRVLDRRANKAPPPSFKVETPAANLVKISVDHPEPKIGHTLLADALGTGDYEFAGGLLTQLTDASRSGKIATKQELNFVLSVVRSINPKDETEALLAAQMAAMHNATMATARRLNHVETIAQQDSASTMLNKLARTFASQVEALKKYRSGGEQTIKVQHVTFNDGGQAIVGNVSQGGGGTSKNGGQPHEPCAADECGPALLGHEQAIPTPMPGTGGPRLEGCAGSTAHGAGRQGVRPMEPGNMASTATKRWPSGASVRHCCGRLARRLRNYRGIAKGAPQRGRRRPFPALAALAPAEDRRARRTIAREVRWPLQASSRPMPAMSQTGHLANSKTRERHLANP